MSKSLRILLVDDNPLMARTLADILEVEGYQVLLANSDVEAMEMIYLSFVDILLTDVRMPGMNGVELAREAVKINPLLRIILLTAYLNDKVLQQARDDGIVNILEKPVDMPFLLSLLKADHLPKKNRD